MIADCSSVNGRRNKVFSGEEFPKLGVIEVGSGFGDGNSGGREVVFGGSVVGSLLDLTYAADFWRRRIR